MSLLKSLDECVSRVAAEAPARILTKDLVTAPHRSYSYGDAEAAVRMVAASVAALPGKSVGVLLSTSFETLCNVYGVMRAGRDVVLIDPEWGEPAKLAIVREVALQSVVADQPIQGALAPLQVTIDKSVSGEGFASGGGACSRIIVFTSGTTSRPKGIVLSQDAMIYAYELGARCLRVDERVKAGCFYRVSGLGILGINFLFPALLGGGTVILPRYAYFSPEEFWSVVLEEEINFLYIVPPIATHLVKEGKPLPSRFAHNEVLCVSGSATLTPEVQRGFQAMYAPLANIYGLSECGFAFLFGEAQGDGFTNSVGSAVGLELKLTDDVGATISDRMRRGRLHVRTPSLFEGYLNDPELTRQVVNDGWLDTRDVAYFDQTGSVHIIGRIDGTIKKGGNLFHLSECEEALVAMPEVMEATCLKINCEIYGEDYVAVVRLTGRGPEPDVAGYLANTLGAGRAPQRVVLSAAELPRNGAGKYDRTALRRLVDG